jgi:hypothetical protein
MTDDLRPLLATFEARDKIVTRAQERTEAGQGWVAPSLYEGRDDAAVEVARATAALIREATLSPADWLDMAEADPTSVNLDEVRYALADLRIGGHAPGGGFTEALCEAITRADTGNRMRLALGFPSLVQAFNVYNRVSGGTARLVALAEYR